MKGVAEVLAILPLLIRLVRAIRGSGRDPKATIEQLAEGYEVSEKVNRRVDKLIDRKFPRR